MDGLIKTGNIKDEVNKSNGSRGSVNRINKEIRSIETCLPKIKPINLPKSREEYEVDENFPQKEAFKRLFLRAPLILEVDLRTLRNFYDFYTKVYGKINHRVFLAYFPKSVDGNLHTTKAFQQFGSDVRSAYYNDFEFMKTKLEAEIEKIR